MEVIDLTMDDCLPDNDPIPFDPCKDAMLEINTVSADAASSILQREETDEEIKRFILDLLPLSQNKAQSEELAAPCPYDSAYASISETDGLSRSEVEDGQLALSTLVTEMGCSNKRERSYGSDSEEDELRSTRAVSISSDDLDLPDIKQLEHLSESESEPETPEPDVADTESIGQSAKPKRTKRPSRQRPLWMVGQSKRRYEFEHIFSLKASSGDSETSIEDDLTVTYTCSLSSLTNWIEQLPKTSLLGFDTEGDGAVLQLCCLNTSRILIFAMPLMAREDYRKACCTAISNVIGSDKYLKVGIAAFDDAIKLHRFWGVSVKSIFDLAYLANDLQISRDGSISRIFSNEKKAGIIVINECAASGLPKGLKSLTREMFVSRFQTLQPIPVDSYQTLEQGAIKVGKGGQKWIEYPLRYYDLLYAAKDALWGSLLYNAMISKFTDAEVVQLKARASTEMHRRLSRPVKPHVAKERLRWIKHNIETPRSIRNKYHEAMLKRQRQTNEQNMERMRLGSKRKAEKRLQAVADSRRCEQQGTTKKQKTHAGHGQVFYGGPGKIPIGPKADQIPTGPKADRVTDGTASGSSSHNQKNKGKKAAPHFYKSRKKPKSDRNCNEAVPQQ